MTIKNCPVCGSPATIRHETICKKSVLSKYRVWIQCDNCGRRTRIFQDQQEPTINTAGGKFAAIAWNAGDHIQAS